MKVWTVGGVRVKRHGERHKNTNITLSVALIYDLTHISTYGHMPGEHNDALVAFTNKRLFKHTHTHKTHNDTNARQHANSRGLCGIFVCFVVFFTVRL